MHMHDMSGICMPVRTSLGPSLRATERLETSAANAAAVLRTSAVDPLPLVGEVARMEPPVRVGVGSDGMYGAWAAALNGALKRHRVSLYACAHAVSR
jgi:hypothetical protein